MLVSVASVTSCSKEPEMKAVDKGKKASTTPKPKGIPLDAKNNLTAIRNGQYVNLGWQLDLTKGGIKRIDILRNATGKKKQMTTVAKLQPNATGYTDCLPNANAHWYWIQLVKDEGPPDIAGPVRVEMDKAGTAGYVKQEDKYKIRITRNDDVVTLKWDFPEDEYAGIIIVRSPRLAAEPFSKIGKKGGTVAAVRTLARKSEHTDVLTHPNFDYWYWVRITLKSGAVIYKGPIKAEYGNQ